MESYTIRYENKDIILSNSKKGGISIAKIDNREIKEWAIRDNKGNLYPLKSHQFRVIFIKKLIKEQVPIARIIAQFTHTSHFLTLKKEVRVRPLYNNDILKERY
ncbi:MAG: hypothetical protein ACRC30_07400 [Clostridium sp.]